MKKLQSFLFLFLLVLVTSCATVLGSPTTEKLMKVYEGMPRQEVLDLLGVPDCRRFDGGLDEWEYTRILSQTEKRVVIIRFASERVTGMDTFRAPVGNPHSHCQQPADHS